MKKNIIFLSGLLCDETVWLEAISDIKHEYNILIKDFRDFNRIETMAEWILDIAPSSFHLVGHSMGARVALEIYKKSNRRIESLSLLDTGSHPVKESEQDARGKLVELANNEGMQALAEEWLPPMLSPENAKKEGMLSPLYAMINRMTPANFSNQVEALLNRPNAQTVLNTISCPTLVGVGKFDVWSPISQHEAMARSIKNSRLTIFEYSGHMSPFEEPKKIQEEIIAFIRAL